MSFELQGTIHKIGEEKQISERLRIISFVVKSDTNEKYIDFVPFKLINDKVDILQDFKEGDFVRVKFNISGRESKNIKGNIERDYFVNLQCWSIIKL